MPRCSIFLFLILLFTASLAAQVGVNTEDPEQALHVNGKVKIGDDRAAPTNGTVRYNDIEEDFQGYSNGEWKSLTKSAGSNVGIPIPAHHISFRVPNDNTWSHEHVDWREGFGNGTISNTTAPIEMATPSGYLYVVDQICVTAREGGTPSKEAFFYAGVRRAFANGGTALNPQIFISGSRDEGTKCVQANRTPLFTLQAGRAFEFWNSSQSEAEVRIVVYGSYVTSLEQWFKH